MTGKHTRKINTWVLDLNKILTELLQKNSILKKKVHSKEKKPRKICSKVAHGCTKISRTNIQPN